MSTVSYRGAIPSELSEGREFHAEENVRISDFDEYQEWIVFEEEPLRAGNYPYN